MDITPVEPGRMATVVLETRDEVYFYSYGVNFFSRALLRFRADNLSSYPVVHTVSLSELEPIAMRINKRADHELNRGFSHNAQMLEVTANRLIAFAQAQP